MAQKGRLGSKGPTSPRPFWPGPFSPRAIWPGQKGPPGLQGILRWALRSRVIAHCSAFNARSKCLYFNELQGPRKAHGNRFSATLARRAGWPHDLPDSGPRSRAPAGPKADPAGLRRRSRCLGMPKGRLPLVPADGTSRPRRVRLEVLPVQAPTLWVEGVSLKVRRHT